MDMETEGSGVSYHHQKKKNRKRKSRFPSDQLNDDVLEHVLSWLPTSDILRIPLISKRWRSLANSPTFHLACSQIPFRDPWFFMVGTGTGGGSESHQPMIVFDSTENNWRKINCPLFLENKCGSSTNWFPVAASGGLLCFQNGEESSELVVCNPVTGASRQVVCQNAQMKFCKKLSAIAMISGPDYYRIVLLSGDLSYTVYDSKSNEWEAEIKLSTSIRETDESSPDHQEEESPMYFLSKCGNVVVSTDIQRNPCKQYSSVTTRKNGEEFVHFLSSSGSIVTCNLTKKCTYEFPRLLPLNFEYSFDLVKSKDEVYLVVLQEFLESASLRVWKYDETSKSWHQIAAMPPAMSHDFFGKRVDINCSGDGEQIMICLNSVIEEDACSYFLCNLEENKWIELPKCTVDFTCGFVFEPRIEAHV